MGFTFCKALRTIRVGSAAILNVIYFIIILIISSSVITVIESVLPLIYTVPGGQSNRPLNDRNDTDV